MSICILTTYDRCVYAFIVRTAAVRSVAGRQSDRGEESFGSCCNAWRKARGPVDGAGSSKFTAKAGPPKHRVSSPVYFCQRAGFWMLKKQNVRFAKSMKK